MNTNTALMSTAWLIFEKIAYVALSLIVTLAIARYLEPELFGRLNYLLAIVALCGPLMALGLNSIVTREILLRPLDNDQVIGSSIMLRFFGGILVSVLAIGLGSNYLNESDHYLFVFLIIASISSCAQVVDFWLQAHMANRYAALLRIFTLIVFSIARLAALYQAAEFEVFIYLAGFEFIFTGALYVLLYRHLSGGFVQLRATIQESKRLLRDARWLFFSGIAAMVYIKIDQVMLGVMVDNHAVGIYAAAARISEVWYFIPAAIVTSFFPQLVKTRIENVDTYERDLQKLNDALFVLSISVAIVVSSSSSWLLPLLFGEAYIDSISILVIHVWVAVFVFMRSLLSKWLLTENLLKLSMASQILGAVVNVCLNYYLIPLYGPLGAAYATVVSYAVASYIVLFLHPRLWVMAVIITRSFMLPLRLLKHGKQLYAIS